LTKRIEDVPVGPPQFVVLPKVFDEKTMVKIGTIPRCEPFTKFEEE
jgi:hypothetical protein